MNCKTGPLFSSLVFFLVSMPALLRAQADREGNHCAIAKSPYRLAMDSGKAVYMSQCVSCHQADGMGSSQFSPPLNGRVVTGDKKKLIEILIGDHASIKQTDEKTTAFVKTADPEMGNQEIAYVLTYIRNSFGNKASAVKVSEVKSLRSY